MGAIKQGILGSFSGKVGTVVGSSWMGISYMRALSPNVKDARSPKQLAQREKFALANAFIKPITLAYNESKKSAVYDMVSSCRGDEGASLSYPSDWVGDTVHIYLGFISENGSLVSDSIYLGEKVIEG